MIIGHSDTSSAVLLPSDKAPDPEKEYVGDIFIRSHANPGDLDFGEFYARQQVDLFKVARAYQVFQVNGLNAVRFDDVGGMLPSTIVAVKVQGRIVEITDFAQNHQEDGIFSAVLSSFSPV